MSRKGVGGKVRPSSRTHRMSCSLGSDVGEVMGSNPAPPLASWVAFLGHSTPFPLR